MQFESRAPRAALAPFVTELWWFAAELPHARERILPTAAPQLLVNLDHDALDWSDGPKLDRHHRIRGACVCGPCDHPFAIGTAQQRSIMGVNFRPGAAGPLLGVPLDALRNLHLALDDLPGADDLRARLLESPPGARLDRLERWLLERVGASPSPAIGHALRALDRGDPVRAVADALGWSPRRLHRRFSRAVGLSPKRYGRLARFRRVLPEVADAPPPSWAELALDHGFFDQAHLVREFKAFAGLTPTRYVARTTNGVLHVALD